MRTLFVYGLSLNENNRWSEVHISKSARDMFERASVQGIANRTAVSDAVVTLLYTQLYKSVLIEGRTDRALSVQYKH